MVGMQAAQHYGVGTAAVKNSVQVMSTGCAGCGWVGIVQLALICDG